MYSTFLIIKLKKSIRVCGNNKEEDYFVSKNIEKGCKRLLASFRMKNDSYFLYEYIYSNKDFSSKYITKLKDEFEFLLDYAIGYPPSLAMARDIFSKLEQILKSKNLEIKSIESFQIIYKEILIFLFEKQKNESFFLAKALVSTGYHLENGYFWILGYIPSEDIVMYSSAYDYYIYDDPIDEFEILDKKILDKISFSSIKDFNSYIINDSLIETLLKKEDLYCKIV